ncbi:MAG: hypothetical protein R6V06_02255 [Kiritimatiellia bacterium]
MKYQIYKDLDCCGHLLFILKFYRYAFTLSDNRDAVGADDLGMLLKAPFACTPAVHKADSRAERLFRVKCQAVKNADKHKFSIAFLAHIVA